MSERLYDVTFVTPVTVRVWARDEEDAKKVAIRSHVEGEARVVHFPESIDVKEVEMVKRQPRGC